nr:DUF4160 domain-containing protein [Agrobacterium rosae]
MSRRTFILMEAVAKVWLDAVRLAQAKGFNQRDIARILETVEEHRDQMMEAWHDYFG